MLTTDYDIKDDRVNGSLPAYLDNSSGSNNSKLLNILSKLESEHRNDLLKISDLVKLDSMSGDTLTRCAEDYGINRIDDDDNFLRFQIRLQKLKGKIGTVTDDTRLFIASALNINPNEFQIVQTGMEEIEIQNIPFSFKTNSKSGIKREIISQAIQSILPPEVLLDDIQYAKKVHNDLYFGISMEKSIERNERMIM